MSPPGRLSKLWKKRARPEPDGDARPNGRYAFETLEPRILLSADPVTGALAEEAAPPPPDPGAPSAEDVSDLTALLEPEAAPADAPTELVFVDASTVDTEQLLADLRAGRDGRQFEVVVIAEDEDGLALISETLDGRSDIDAIHVVSHATEGSVRLGNLWLGQAELAAQSELVESWQSALGQEADLLFYGCDLAGSAGGQALVQELARLTGADVAASDDLTGASELGGDWDLEVTAGVVETGVAFSSEAQDGWQAVLATATFQQGFDFYSGTDDTFLDENDADGSQGIENRIEVDTATDKQGLIRFDDIFGPNPGQIPYGSTITAATLTFEVDNQSSPGSTVSLHRMLAPWEFTSTWNELGAGIQTDDVEAGALPDATLSPADASGVVQFTGLASTVQAWSDGETNLGWTLTIDDSDDWRVFSSNELDASKRPLLSIDYTPPAAVAQDPVIWISPDRAVTASDVPELPSWTEGHILQLDDPGLTFGDPTDGTWSLAADMDPFSIAGLNPDALHYVSTNMTLGGTGFPSIELLAGDVLFSTNSNETIGSLVVEDEDIALFRPDAPGDYSSGSFSMLLNNPTAFQIEAFSLVESNTTVGGTLLPKGSFVVGFDGTSDLFAFTVDDVGFFTTSIRDLGGAGGSVSFLFDGSDIGITTAFDGIEVIEQNVSVGGVLLQAGQIVATLNVDGTGVGSGTPIDPDDSDAFVLDVISTGVFSDATATMFLEGSGVHLEGLNGAGLEALTLGTHVEQAPSLAGGATATYNEGDPAIVLAGAATASDVDGADLAGGSLSVSLGEGGTPYDRLAVRDEGVGFGNISLSGSSVRFDFGVGPVEIGTVSGGSGAGDPLIVVLNGSADLASLQALMRAVTYENVAIVPSEANREISFTVTEGGGAQSDALDVTVDFEVPHSLWLNAADDTDPSDTNLARWLAGDVVEIGPGATFGEDTTSGDFAQVFSLFLDDDSDADLQALHYASSYVDLGSGANFFQVRPGDVLATIDGASTQTLKSTNNLDVTDNDVFVFRPDTPGNYSSGTFTMLLKDPVGANIHAITLVEREVVLPDKTLNAGSFLLAHSGPSFDENIFLYEATDVGSGLTNGTKSPFLDGSSFGTNGAHVRGLDLIEEATTIGDATLTAGQLLVSFNNAETIGLQDVLAWDVAVFDITATEFGTGTSVTAGILLDGDDLNLADISEEIDGLSLGRVANETNQGPTATVPSASYPVSENASLALHGTGMSVSDPDAAGAAVRVGLSVGEGTLSVSAGGTGVLVTNPISGAVTLDGTLAQINALLSGASAATIFYDALDAPSASTVLTLGIDDLGNTGIGGALTGDDAATLVITSQNDAPSLANGSLSGVAEEAPTPAGETVGIIFAGQFSDPDAGGSFGGIAAVGNAANPVAEGSWQYSTDAGANWSDIGSVGDDATALAIDAASLIRFLPAADFTGVPTSLVVRGLDDTHAGYSTTGVTETRITVDTSVPGGDSAIAASTADLGTSVSPVGDTPVAASIVTLEDTQTGLIVLDKNANDGAEVTHLRISGITNGSLFLADGTTAVSEGTYITLAQGQAGLRFTPDPGTNLAGSFDVESSENGTSVAAQSGQAASTITVTPVGDTPVAASIVTLEDTQSGLILLDKNANDGAEVSHLRISGIANGSLFLADGTTAVAEGAYITLAQGQAGLRFTPDPGTNLAGSFDVESSEDGTSVAAQSGKATSTITVTPVGDNPVAASIVTLEDTQTGLIVLDKNAGDGAEVTHLRISGITNGSLFLADGTTAVSEGAYITLAQGQAGLRFTPDPDTNVAGSFDVESSENGTSVAAQSGQAASTITVTPVGDTPVAASIVTLEDTQSGLILLDKNANDGAEVSHLRISGIANGSLFLADGTTAVAEGAYITLAQGQAGLRFTPDPGTNLAGSFDVESSEDGTSVAAQSGKATSTITVTPVGDNPVAASIVTLEDTQSGLIVLDKNAGDGAEVTHLRISGITNGSLFLADGTTAVSEGAYITLAQGQAGLRFTPDPGTNLAGSFDVESSENGTSVAAQSGQAASTITVTPVGDTPVAASIVTLQDTLSAAIALDKNANDGAEVTHLRISGITNGTLFQNDGATPILSGDYITLAQGQAGLRFLPSLGSVLPGSFQVESSEDGLTVAAQSGQATSTISITGTADTPSVTNSVTLEDSQTTAGLVISRNPLDGAEVTHFKITGISGGSLFQNDGVTAISNGDFITFAQGNAGLRFTPMADSNSNGSFDAQASTVANDAGLGGGVVTATVSVTPVGDTPQTASLTTDEDTQSALIALDKNANDGAEVTHLRISGITNGSLFLADGTTPVADGAYVTLAQGQAGLRFTPGAESNLAGSFRVEASEDGSSVAAQSGQAVSTVTVTPVGDTPVAASISTAEDVQSGLILLDKNPNDGAEVTHLRISGITGGSLFLADGTTPVGEGTYITLGQGQAGLRFSASQDSTAAGSFQVESSQDGTSVAVQSGQAASAISVTPVNDPPSATIAPASYTVEGGVSLTLEGTGLSVGDVDAGGVPVRATLSVGEGSIAVTAGGTGVTVGGTPTSVTLDGTLSQINALLSGGAGATVRYDPPASPSGSGTLTLAIDDLGASGAGVPLADSDVASFTLLPPVTTPPPVEPPTVEPPPVVGTGEGEGEAEATPETGSEETGPEDEDEAETLVGAADPPSVPGVSSAGPDLAATLDVVERALRSLGSGEELEPLQLGSASPRGSHGAGEARAEAVSQVRSLLLQLIPTEELEHRIDGLMHELDELRDELKNQSDVERLVVGSITGSASALSIGYVVWLLRGGMLLSSVLSSLPAWQLVDPLPVLGHLMSADDEEEDESLAEIARRKTTREQSEEARERVE